MDKPAFPIPIAGCTDGSVYNTMEQSAGQLGGMTLREYAAVAAMQGLLASSVMMTFIIEGCNGEDSAPMVAQMSADLADALLARLEEGK